MRIAFNGLSVDNRSGTGRYATELLRALARVCDPEDPEAPRFLVFLPEDHALLRELGPRVNFRVEPLPPGGGPTLRILREEFRFKKALRGFNPDLFHAPAFMAPERLPCPLAVTIHDLVFLKYPKTIPALRRHYYHVKIPRAIRRARLVFADSRSTAEDLRRHFRLEEKRLSVVPLGVGREYFEDWPEDRLQDLRRRRELPPDFFLTVGTREPRKNLEGLLRAAAAMWQQRPKAPHLVIAGRLGWGAEHLAGLAEELGCSGRVHFPGYLPDEELPGLYRLCRAFLCVSFYEGFGLPLLEAMAAGRPVVASDRSALPELAADHGWLVDPADTKAIAAAMLEIFDRPEEAARRARLGCKQAEAYSWDATARRTLRGYQQALGDTTGQSE